MINNKIITNNMSFNEELMQAAKAALEDMLKELSKDEIRLNSLDIEFFGEYND